MSEIQKDPLLASYHEASTQENGAPSASVREAVLARAAGMHANAHEALGKRTAANDKDWRWRAAASIAVIGFTGMVVRQYLIAPPAQPAASGAPKIATPAAVNENPLAETLATPDRAVAKTQDSAVQVAEIKVAQTPLKPASRAPTSTPEPRYAVDGRPRATSSTRPREQEADIAMETLVREAAEMPSSETVARALDATNAQPNSPIAHSPALIERTLPTVVAAAPSAAMSAPKQSSARASGVACRRLRAGCR